MKNRQAAEIVKDVRGYRKIEMPRNHPRIVQSSVDLLQSWRGNCDIQVILYESDPDNPDPEDVARVTDYVVAYACKGNASIVEEKTQAKSIILR
jgi:hypothetical protein